ncbi:MAG: type II toxin-antitoxin system RelE/ParE family toxin [Myxococcaceae bacterium]
MIISFADQATEGIYNGMPKKAALKLLGKALWSVAQRKLIMLNAATAVKDLMSPPGNKLEKLSGNLRGRFSIRINQQFRIVFVFLEGNASEVQIVDYH